MGQLGPVPAQSLFQDCFAAYRCTRPGKGLGIQHALLLLNPQFWDSHSSSSCRCSVLPIPSLIPFTPALFNLFPIFLQGLTCSGRSQQPTRTWEASIASPPASFLHSSAKTVKQCSLCQQEIEIGLGHEYIYKKLNVLSAIYLTLPKWLVKAASHHDKLYSIFILNICSIFNLF